MRGTAAAMRLFAVMVWPLGQVHKSKLRGLPPHGGDAGVTLDGVNVEPSLEKNPLCSIILILVCILCNQSEIGYTFTRYHCIKY